MRQIIRNSCCRKGKKMFFQFSTRSNDDQCYCHAKFPQSKTRNIDKPLLHQGVLPRSFYITQGKLQNIALFFCCLKISCLCVRLLLAKVKNPLSQWLKAWTRKFVTIIVFPLNNKRKGSHWVLNIRMRFVSWDGSHRLLHSQYSDTTLSQNSNLASVTCIVTTHTLWLSVVQDTWGWASLMQGFRSG